MKTILYVDCQNGISGDMLVGAFIDAGMPLSHLKRIIQSLHLHSVEISCSRVLKNGFLARQFRVVEKKKNHPHGFHVKEFHTLIHILPPQIRDKAGILYTHLMRAEQKVHGSIKKAHIHEIGAIDSLIDLVAIATGLTYFNIDEVYSSFVPLNQGFVTCAHGQIPLPAPATVVLLKHAAIKLVKSQFELTTPTGASFLAAFCKHYGRSPEYRLTHIGSGAGMHTSLERANILRLLIGQSCEREMIRDEIYMVETTIDDMNPQWYEMLFKQLFSTNAVDVYLTNALMKKQRPGVVLHVLCKKEDLEQIKKCIFMHSTTFGLRYYPVSRTVLEREIKKIKTSYGKIDVKIGKYQDKIVTISPEYETCKKLALKKQISLKKIRE